MKEEVGAAEKLDSEEGKDVVVPNKKKQLVSKSVSDQVMEGIAPANYKPYPKPLAKYEEVIANPKLFRETLEKLHATLGTKFMVPTIGARELDLHQLFIEVTSRGGIEKVIADRRWKEVTAAFSFPSTATNASFVLRKYYMSLLHHYEQIYFFGSQGCSCPPTAPSHTPVTSGTSARSMEPMMPYPETQAVAQKRRRRNGLSSPTNTQVVGVIDGKFEGGYFVTVTVGLAKLKGVLYHTPEQIIAQVPQYSGVSYNSNVRGTRCRQRRKKLSKRDPAHPKPNRSGYNFFFAEQHARLKPLHPQKDREISKMIGDLWNNLTESEKAVYQERGLKDKERYRSEMAVYKERLQTGQIISNAVPIQQRPAEPEGAAEDVHLKMETDEGALTLANQNDNSTKGSDSEEKNSDEDSEMETSPEVGGVTIESTSLADPSNEGDGFKLRTRGDVKLENKHDLPSSIKDAKSKKFKESSTDKQ
ncbi:high mobility group B protein 15-like [Phoenix dactylifera]|uniref:High mobility group B protein 15-like n=1 Tax=Phoenix dactylifera TaxID=42345 RepID=A0A8B9ASM2_PHODC|nr:high mobility group B protein 15-like [Phoenix dactylifera]XP_008813623.2 high mobility group B protein 15-like [Phoenix dactylifera]XP_026656211.2 high mobility group B protein 15-like [Phoenix dactylifera]XP_026656212.2 high mobility group B protein 15-like [Phoenix dactylifera]XP_026656213.2 high mobility group B protein 15-like [Phoenix dactylifera]XP_038986943.1 high mobility group B protein 15-like [Phoenix dactylifera]